MKEILTTLCYGEVPAWVQRADMLDRWSGSRWGLLRAIVSRAGRYGVVVLDGTSPTDQMAAAIIGRWRRPPRVLMTDATWKRGDDWLDHRAMVAGLRAMDGPHITYGVLSSFERDAFPRTWGVAPERVVFTPFHYTLTRAELERPVSDDGSVFAGGDSLRDYAPLVAAAARLPARVTIATALLDGAVGLPDNVRSGRLSHDAFVERLRSARVVVVPMPANAERSSGQQTYLNAMALGKVAVVTDSPGVRDHVEHERTGLIVPPHDADALERAVAWAVDSANAGEVAALGARAQETARTRFSRARYAERLLELIAGDAR